MASELREVLSKQAPNVEFDDTLIQHLVNYRQECENDDEVVDAWSQFIIDVGAAPDGASANELCLRVLKQLDAETSAINMSKELAKVSGLSEWLCRLHLDGYTGQSLEWCRQNRISDIRGILKDWARFCAEVDLKRLERKRVQEDAEKHCMLDVKLRGRPTFGNPPYSIMELLGEGATAKVYRCVRIENGELISYAVKVVDLRPYRLEANFDEILAKLKREINILFHLQHDNIVSLFEVVDGSSADDRLYFVMELVPGGDLLSYINNHGCFIEENAARIFTQLVFALKFVHHRGVVHRDLKPENILVNSITTRGLRVKISDFGHSKLLNDGHSIPLTKVGTPQYWAPEVQDEAQRKKGYDEKVDLWSLGVVLFVMLTGHYPFEVGDRMMVEKIQKGMFSYRAGRTPSEDAQDLIKKLVVPNPCLRLALDECMKHPWVQQHVGNAGDCASRNLIEDNEETIILPTEPTDIVMFRSALDAFTVKSRFGVRLSGKQQLVVLWRTAGLSGKDLETNIAIARVMLSDLLHAHFPGFVLQPRLGIAQVGPVSSGYASSETSCALRKTFRLRVHPEKGAGLSLIEESNGMIVHEIEEIPGQPGLLCRDVIVEINGERLGPDAEQACETFSRNFKDGVVMTIIRQT